MSGQRVSAFNAQSIEMGFASPRYQVFLPDIHPPFPYIAFESGSVNTLWLMGDLYVPERVTGNSAAVMANPMLNPTNIQEVVYSAEAIGSTDSLLYIVDLKTNTRTLVKTETGIKMDLAPYWHPNGTTIVYVFRTGSPGAGNEVWRIKSIERDGTGGTTLYTYNTGATFSLGLSCPCYSPSGDYIAFGKGFDPANDEVWIMNADGSGAAAVDSSGTGLQWSAPYSYMGWQNNSDVLGWGELGASVSDGVTFKKVNADGTGLTTLHNVPSVSSPSPQLHSVGTGRFPWLLDDSGMVTLIVDGSTDPRWRLALIDGSGGGASWIGSVYSYASGTGNPFAQPSWNYSPTVFREQPWSDGRIYFTLGNSTGSIPNQDVVSVEPDGSDLRTDDDGTQSPAHGYWTITGTAD